ncbi:hypothetical protein IU501_10990 [Nocardia otitidiscaviarum]|uniref:hypothetical protein n=1 Tax=Nocardia otitidiscaviarum TaxID=1823 RepID=UPI0018956347|nr:hypothetical protein [Nocardia otitidiscaviarum]MBF6133525.1 hypothetical protein [Nocardia otitidiscaviarum]
MALYTHGVSPPDIRLGDENVLRLYLGDVLVWDGTSPVLISAPPAVSTGGVPAPTVQAGARIPAPAAASTGTGATPSFAGGCTIDAPTAVASNHVPAPDIRAGVVVGTPPAVSVGTGPAPSVGDTVIDAPTATSTGTVPTPAAKTGVTVTTSHAPNFGTAPAPDISAGATVPVPAATSTGTAPAPTFQSFQPSGMNKNGTLGSSNSWADVTGWTADTTNYPGSVVTDNRALVANGGQAAVTLRAEVAFAPGGAYFSGTGFQIQILVNGSPAQTGAGVPASSGTAVCETVTSISNGDQVKVQARANNSYTQLPVIQVSGTFLRIT